MTAGLQTWKGAARLLSDMDGGFHPGKVRGGADWRPPAPGVLASHVHVYTSCRVRRWTRGPARDPGACVCLMLLVRKRSPRQTLGPRRV